jgi:hypothetical protein
VSEHRCPNCDEGPYHDTGPRISSASIHRSMEAAARARRIRDAESAVLAAAEAQAVLGARTGPIADFKYELACKATNVAVRAYREARK